MPALRWSESELKAYRQRTGLTTDVADTPVPKSLARPAPVQPLVVFSLPMIPPTLNEWQRSHWREQHRIACALEASVITVAGDLVPAEPFEQVRVSIVRASSGQPDPDGLVGGLKPLIDALVHVGFICDDNPKVLRLYAGALLCARGDEHTLVRVQHGWGHQNES